MIVFNDDKVLNHLPDCCSTSKDANAAPQRRLQKSEYVLFPWTLVLMCSVVFMCM